MKSVTEFQDLNKSFDYNTGIMSALSLLSHVSQAFQTKIGILVGILLTGYLVQVSYYLFLHPISTIPGPFLARFSYLWINIRYMRGSWHQDILAVHRRYGDVVRITPNEVSFVDAQALKLIYGYSTGTKKTPWYSVWLEPTMGLSFFGVQDPATHKFLRSRVSGAYTLSSVLAMEPDIQQLADNCWSRFREYAKLGKSVNVSDWVSYFAFDVISQLGMGGALGFLDKGGDVDEVITSVHGGSLIMSSMGHVPLQMWWFWNPVSRWALESFGGEKLNAFPNFLKWLKGRIANRMENAHTSNGKDMLQHFIEMRGKADSDSATLDDILVEAVIVLGAGADTTSIAILAILGTLVTHPEILPRLQQEVDKAYKRSGLGQQDGISYNDAIKLPYLSAVIKESMRLHPSLSFQLPRYAPVGGIQIGKYFLPEGTHLGISATAMNRSKDTFGQNAEEFEPERWIPKSAEDEERIKEMARLLTTFGMGPRVCIGQNIALVEIYKFVAQFVRQFELESCNPKEPWKTHSHTFVFRSEFWVKFTLREDVSEVH